MVVLGVAALLHVVRYALLIVNRSMLLNPLVAGAATWLGVLVSVLAMFAVVASAVVLTNWLIARRAAAFAHRGHEDPRPLWALRAGCLVPLVNLVWAPVYVMELAAVEDRLAWLRRPIIVWWIVWVVSTLVSVFSIATSFTTDAQGIADNTVTTTVAYLLALAALLLATQVFSGFERNPVERPARRWVIVAEEPPEARPEAPELRAGIGVFRLSPKGRTRQHSRMNSGDGALGGHPFVVAHRGASAERPEHTRGRLRTRAPPGRRRRRVRCAADQGRAPGVRARPAGGSDIDRNRAGQRDDAGPASRTGLRVMASRVGGPTAPTATPAC